MAKKYDDIFDIEESYSLESILAEYKGASYTAEPKKSSDDEVEKLAQQLLKEAQASVSRSGEPEKPKAKPVEEIKAEPIEEKQEVALDFDDIFQISAPAKEEPQRIEPVKEELPEEEPVVEKPKFEGPKIETVKPTEQMETSSSEMSDSDDDFFASLTYAKRVEKPAPEAVNPAVKEEKPKIQRLAPPVEDDGYDEYDEYDEYDDESESFFGRFAAKFKKNKPKYEENEYDEYDEATADEIEGDYGDEAETPVRERASLNFEDEEMFFEEEEYDEYDEADDEWEEPDFAEEITRILKKVKGLSFRCTIALGISVFLSVLTLAFELGWLPFSWGENTVVIAGILLVGQAAVMLLGYDLIADGLGDFIKAEPGAESLIVVSNLVTCLQVFLVVANGDIENGLPFCAVSAFAVYFGMRGTRLYNMGMAYSLRTAISVERPYGVISEYGKLEGREILKKTSSLDGFYKNLTRRDICQDVYSKAAPLFMLAAVVFAVLCSILRGRSHDFAYTFAAVLVVSASMSSMMAFNLPFYITARKARKAGGAVAGWGGACEIFDADGALITDEDIFPVGTVSLSGIKLFEGITQYKAITYTASIISASGSGLTKCFEELLQSQNGRLYRVDDFACYEGGGIGGLISGDRVMAGSVGFMSLMGIRVPDSLNVKNAVYTAVNGELKAIFSINYVPANSVQTALISMIKTRINMLLAARDFNVTPAMLQQRFKISLRDIEYISIEDCYRLSDESPSKGCMASAVLCRDGLGPFAEIVMGGIQLRNVATLTTIASVVASVVGMLLVSFICWRGELETVSAGNILVMMLAVQGAILLLSRLSAKR